MARKLEMSPRGGVGRWDGLCGGILKRLPKVDFIMNGNTPKCLYINCLYNFFLIYLPNKFKRTCKIFRKRKGCDSLLIDLLSVFDYLVRQYLWGQAIY